MLRPAVRQNDLYNLRVGVLYGGDSPEREGSLISGRAAAGALTELGYPTELIDTAKTSLSELTDRIDVALLALHGPGGEDGKTQGALETLGIPYAGSGVLSSAVAMHKPTFKQLIRAEGINTPAYTVARPGPVLEIVDQIGLPLVFKPASGGGSLETTIVRTHDELADLLGELGSGDYGDFMA